MYPREPWPYRQDNVIPSGAAGNPVVHKAVGNLAVVARKVVAARKVGMDIVVVAAHMVEMDIVAVAAHKVGTDIVAEAVHMVETDTVIERYGCDWMLRLRLSPYGCDGYC